MKIALYGLILLTLGGEVLCSLLWDDRGRVRKYVTLVFSLVLTLSLAAPAVSVLKNEDNTFVFPSMQEGIENTAEINSEITSQSLVFDETERLICQSVINALETKYDIAPDTVGVAVTVDRTDSANAKLTQLQVTLQKASAAILKQKIEAYLSDTFVCDCEVVT